MLPTIRHGDEGVTVQIAQLLTDYEPADGIYNAYFVSHVTAWQSAHGCDPDGVIGPKTWAAIAANAPTVSYKVMRYGPYAKAAQLLLGVDADGIFGAKSRAAAEAFQKAHGLSVDGVVGPKTWETLITGSAEAPAGECPNIQPPNFKQYDSRWGGIMYSNHNDKKQTIKSSGCGPTSMADIVAQWWDVTATPADLARLSLDWGCRTYDSGTTSSFFRKCAEKYKATDYKTAAGIDAAKKCLDAGGYVIVCFGPGKQGKPGYRKWTKGGHYCVIWGYKGDTFYINDPASASSARAKGTREEILNARKGFYLFWW